jgi:hypothetical protein
MTSVSYVYRWRPAAEATDPVAAWNFSVAMTTRGGPGIVLASLAYLGIIS